MYALSFFQDNNRTQMQDYDRHKELENESIARLLWRYSLPAIVGTLVNSLYNVVDRIYIGQGAGPMAIAGLALTFPIMNILGACGMLIGQGAATQVSLFLGRHDNRTANNILGNAVVMDLMMFAVVSTVMYIFLDEILILLGGTEEIIPYAHEYMQVILPFHVITSMSFSTNNIMRASGYPRKAMWTLVIGAVLNVVLDPIFIFGFDMGIRGAAIATVISMTVSCAWVMIHFADSRHTVHLSLKDMRLRWSTMLKILAIGLSPFFLQVGISLVNIVMNHTLRIYGGAMAIGAFGIVSTFATLIITSIVGLNQGMQPIIGYNYGFRRPDRVRKTLRYGIIAATAITTLGWLCGELFPRQMALCFNNDPELTALTAHAIRIFMCVHMFVGAQIVITNYFQSIGKAGISIFLSLTRQIIFLVPCLLILPPIFGLDGAWMAQPAANVLAFAVSALMLRRELRRETYTYQP